MFQFITNRVPETPNVAECLLELVCVAKRATTLVSRGATQILLSALGSAAKQQPSSEDLLLVLHQILAKIGPKGGLTN